MKSVSIYNLLMQTDKLLKYIFMTRVTTNHLHTAEFYDRT